MKIFAAIAYADTVKMFYEKTGIKLNYLISYFYLDGQTYRLTTEYRDMIDTLFLDSGAYSAQNGNIVISQGEYRKYLKLYGDRFAEYFNLDDEFDNPDHNLTNQGFIEKGLPAGTKRPIPVVHDNKDPFVEFSNYAESGYEYIAFGSTIKIPDEVFERIKEKYPRVKIHIFGRLDWDELKKHKPDSADAASWAHVASNGSILYWDPDEFKNYIISVGSRDKKHSAPHFKTFEHRKKLEEFLYNTFKYEYSDLIKKRDAYNRMIVNLYFYKQMQDYLTSLETPPTTSSK